ncbi:hypothetical protein C9J85_05460 [Haloferax sp. wsp5]|nr:hypothetical protein C9J85_05460 [Haloferax sp. wsp5]
MTCATSLTTRRHLDTLDVERLRIDRPKPLFECPKIVVSTSSRTVSAGERRVPGLLTSRGYSSRAPSSSGETVTITQWSRIVVCRAADPVRPPMTTLRRRPVHLCLHVPDCRRIAIVVEYVSREPT